MTDMPVQDYESVFRNTPMAAIGFVGILAAAAVAAWAAIAWLPAADLTLPLLEVAVFSIVAIVFVAFVSRARHRWRMGAEDLEISESGALSWSAGARATRIPLTAIVALRRVESGFDSILEVETVSGGRHWLMQSFARDKAGVLLPDTAGFNQFANALRQRIAQVNAGRPVFHDGLGFWNTVAGLALLTGILTITLGLSGLILYGVFSGMDMPNGAAMQGLVFVLLLPAGAGYALYRALVRRSFVLGLGALRDDLRAKG